MGIINGFLEGIVFLGALANVTEVIRCLVKYKRAPMINIYLVFIICILYYNYFYSQNLAQLIGMLAVTYCSIVMLLNRKYRFSHKVNAILYIPFVTSIAFFLALIVKGI